MLRILFLVVALLLLVALVTRADTLRRALYVILAAMALYAVLKTTGVIEAWAPDRIGVF
jgi:hypothetical protein